MSVENERYAQLAAKVLVQPLREDTPHVTRLDRDTMVASMVGVIEARSRAKRLLRIGSTLALAAGVTFAIYLGTQKTTPPIHNPSNDVPVVAELRGQNHVLIRQGVSQILQKNTPIATGDHLLVPSDSSSVLAFTDGTRAEIGQKSEVEITQLGIQRRLSLEHGRMDLRVAKLGPSGRFQVTTPDSSVEVHGTVFSVAVHNSKIRCGNLTTTTQVQVSEGVVSVEHGGSRVYLHAGEIWPCDATKPAITPGEMEPAPKAPTHRASSRRTSPAPTPLSFSNLEEQNDLFQEAMSAERRKDWETANHLINSLIRRFPGGALEESARVEQKKILRELNR